MRPIVHLPLVALLLTGVLHPAYGQSAISWSGDLQMAQQAAQRDGRLLLIHFYIDSCAPCLRVERDVFPRGDVAQAIANHYVPVKLDGKRAKGIASHFQVVQYPTDVIADAGGRVLLRTMSPLDPAEYVRMLESVAAQHGRALPNHQARPEPDRASPGSDGGQSWAPQGSGDPSVPRQPLYGTDRVPQEPYSNPRDLSREVDPNPYPSRPASYGPRYGAAYPDGQWQPGSDLPRRGGFQPNLGVDPNQATGVPARVQSQVDRGQANSYVPDVRDPRYASLDPIDRRAQNQMVHAPTASAELPLSLNGYCPVTLVEREEYHQGEPEWGMMHRGRTYRFASYDAMQKFRADPDRYSPVMSGFDVVRFVDSGEVAVGKRRHGVWYHGKMYLFSDEASLERFSRSYAYYEQRAYEVMVNARR